MKNRCYIVIHKTSEPAPQNRNPYPKQNTQIQMSYPRNPRNPRFRTPIRDSDRITDYTDDAEDADF